MHGNYNSVQNFQRPQSLVSDQSASFSSNYSLKWNRMAIQLRKAEVCNGRLGRICSASYVSSKNICPHFDEIVQLPSAGIFLKSNDQLVTWMMCHPPNGMSRLLTLEPHRRKGYASLVTKYLTKRMAQSGHFPYINIVAGNPVSRKFFESIGFRYLGAGHVWVTSPPTW